MSCTCQISKGHQRGRLTRKYLSHQTFVSCSNAAAAVSFIDHALTGFVRARSWAKKCRTSDRGRGLDPATPAARQSTVGQQLKKRILARPIGHLKSARRPLHLFWGPPVSSDGHPRRPPTSQCSAVAVPATCELCGSRSRCAHHFVPFRTSLFAPQ